jgi:ferredoxin
MSTLRPFIEVAGPVATVTYKSAGRALIIGELGAAEQAAGLLGDALDVTLFTQGGGDLGAAQERRYPVLGGQIQSLAGWLGAFVLNWQPNNPTDLDLQNDLQAIDATHTPQSHSFDLVLDLRTTPAFSQHAKPQGYLHWDGCDMKALLAWRELVGEFEKPVFFNYQQKLCAHSRNDKVACTACVDVCSASAISSDFKRQRVLVNPKLCVGCGACSTVCPTGAMGFAYPRARDLGVKLKTLLASYQLSGAKDAALLLHSQGSGARLLGDLGRAAQLEKGQKDGTHGVPARVLPLALWHTASTGLELWLSAVAFGATKVWVLLTDEEAPQYAEALRSQMAVAQSILTGLGYAGAHFKLLQVRDARDLAALGRDLQTAPAQAPARQAGFAVQAEKRATLELALDHLINHAPQPSPAPIALPASGSPLGGLAINKDSCTLCLSCVTACPAAALAANAQALQLRFVEKNCVQCGLCVATCPEHSLSLVPRLNLAPQRKEQVMLNEMAPYACVRCGKPFGTLKAIEGMLAKLAGHSMFQGAALERLKMCGDCRVSDIKITDVKA